jgi:hypothetical protein
MSRVFFFEMPAKFWGKSEATGVNGLVCREEMPSWLIILWVFAFFLCIGAAVINYIFAFSNPGGGVSDNPPIIGAAGSGRTTE